MFQRLHQLRTEWKRPAHFLIQKILAFYCGKNGAEINFIRRDKNYTAQRFDWSACFQVFINRPDKATHEIEPRRRRTQRSFLKPRSLRARAAKDSHPTAPFTSGFRIARSVQVYSQNFLREIPVAGVLENTIKTKSSV
jgi:hypothetical protein